MRRFFKARPIVVIDNAVYDQLAATWWHENGILHMLKAGLNPWRIPYFQRVLAFRQVDPTGKRALDVGCGGGLVAEEFATMGFAVTGVDPSYASLQAARDHAAQSGLRIEYCHGYGDALPFANETFEVVYCCDVLEHIRNWDAVVCECARVLKPDGLFLYDTLNRTAFSKLLAIKLLQEWHYTRVLPLHLHVWEMFIRPAELHASLEHHGLRSQNMRGINLFMNPIQALRAIRQYKTGKISGAELGKRVSLREGANMAASYMGYAIK